MRTFATSSTESSVGCPSMSCMNRSFEYVMWLIKSGVSSEDVCWCCCCCRAEGLFTRVHSGTFMSNFVPLSVGCSLTGWLALLLPLFGWDRARGGNWVANRWTRSWYSLTAWLVSDGRPSLVCVNWKRRGGNRQTDRQTLKSVGVNYMREKKRASSVCATQMSYVYKHY